MSDIGQQSTTSTTFSVHNVSVIHVVPQLSLVLGEATDKDSTASALSFMRGRGFSRRVIKTATILVFVSMACSCKKHEYKTISHDKLSAGRDIIRK